MLPMRLQRIGLVSFRRGLHPQDSAHAGRTKKLVLAIASENQSISRRATLTFRLGRTWLHYAFGGPIGVYVWELAVRIQLLRATSRGELAVIGLAGSLLLAAHPNQREPALIYSEPRAKCRWLKIWRRIEDF
jgi:hypothetical protein